jgi:DNA transformation protein
MTRPLSSLKGLGPRSEDMLAQVGIHSAEALLAADPYEVYARLKATVPGISLNALYALMGAIEDRNWLDIKRERKGEILMRLEDMGLAPR